MSTRSRRTTSSGWSSAWPTGDPAGEGAAATGAGDALARPVRRQGPRLDRRQLAAVGPSRTPVRSAAVTSALGGCDRHVSRSPDRRARAGVAGAAWTQQLRARDLFFGDRPVCTVLRPRFLSPSSIAPCGPESVAVMRAVPHRVRGGDGRPGGSRPVLALTDWEERLIACGPAASATRARPLDSMPSSWTTGCGSPSTTRRRRPGRRTTMP